jgi:hypothetical protein
MQLPWLKQHKSPFEAKASILSLKSASQDAQNQLVVTASGSLKGVKASGLARACEDPQIRRLAHGVHRGEDDRFRRGIAEKGEGHMKGVESIYTSGKMVIEAGSAG